MAISFTIKNLDEMFRASPIEPVIINDLPNKTEEDRKAFMRLTEERFSSDIISIKPICRCGSWGGEHRLGQIAPCCGYPVTKIIEGDLIAKVWFRRPGTPEGFTVEKLINPMIWIFLSERFKKGKFKVLNWLTDRNYRCPGKEPACIQDMRNTGIERGYNFFVQNFWEITKYLLNHPDFRSKIGNANTMQSILDMLEVTNENEDPLIEVLEMYKENIFSDYIPLINKGLIVLEPHSSGLWGEKSVSDIKDVMNTMVSIDADFYDRSVTTLENRTGRIMSMLTEYYMAIFKTNFDPKEGLPRRHLGATRTNMSFRTVMTSHDGVQGYDEIWMPWCVGVICMSMHLQRYLMDRSEPYGGMTHNEALDFLNRHIYVYHPTIDELLQRLISEARGGYIDIMVQRNPSLMQGSMELLRGTKFKTDPEDCTTSVSDLVAGAMNLDYDGRSNKP